MKIKSPVFLLILLFAMGILHAEEAVLRADGSLETGALRLVPYASTTPWWTGYAYPQGDHAAKIDFMNRVNVTVSPMVTVDPDGSIYGAWQYSFDKATHPGKFECGLMAEIHDKAQIESLSWNSDAGCGSWKHPKRVMPNWALRQFTLKFGDKVALDCTFPQPTWVHLYDRGGYWILRIGRQPLDAAPGTYALKVNFKGNDRMTLGSRDVFRVCKNQPGWTPFTDEPGILPGSALDFSSQRPTRAPCGVQGKVVINDKGHFAFASDPTRPVRFYGVNLCYDAQYMEPAKTDEMLDTFVRMGYNAVRIHHWEVDLMKTYGSAGYDFDEEKLDRLGYLVAGCSKRGLYLTTDLYVSRTVTKRELGEDSDERVWDIKDRIHTDPAAFADYIRFVEAVFGRTNPHTGRKLCDDPAWLCLHLVGEPPAEKLAASEVRDFIARTRQALKEKLDWTIPLSDLNVTDPEIKGRDLPQARDAMDYVDYHFYIDHPAGISANSFACPGITAHAKPEDESVKRYFEKILRVQRKDRPFTVSEYNWCGPNAYRAGGPYIVGDLADTRGWDAIWRFSWANHAADMTGLQPAKFFFLASDPLARAADRLATGVFLRGRKTLRVTRTDDVTVGIEAVDGRPLAQSRRLLVSHLTDLQNEGAIWLDDSRREYLSWGRPRHFVSNRKDEIVLSLDDPAGYRVWALSCAGARLYEVASTVRDGALVFAADSAGDGEAVMNYEVEKGVTFNASRPTPLVRTGKFPGGKLAMVSFTFDDGLRDQYEVAAPILEKYGYRGIFSIVTSWIGADDAHMTWDMVRDLQRRGHLVASHTINHVTLQKEWNAAAKNPARREELAREITGSRDIIERETGVAPKVLCPPYNSLYTPDLKKIVRDAGLIAMTDLRENFGAKTQWSHGVEEAGKWLDRLVEDEKYLPIMVHGVTPTGGGYAPFAEADGFERLVKAVKAREDRIFVTDYLTAAEVAK